MMLSSPMDPPIWETPTPGTLAGNAPSCRSQTGRPRAPQPLSFPVLESLRARGTGAKNCWQCRAACAAPTRHINYSGL